MITVELYDMDTKEVLHTEITLEVFPRQGEQFNYNGKEYDVAYVKHIIDFLPLLKVFAYEYRISLRQRHFGPRKL
jgi:hypothetical protein